MSDKSKAASWFLHHYVKQKFDFEAKLKKYDISKFNKAINELFTESQSFLFNKGHSCGHCFKHFNLKAIPVLCPLCLKQTHKSRCQPCPNISAPLSAPPQQHLLAPPTPTNTVSFRRLSPTTSSRLIQTVSLQSPATPQSPSRLSTPITSSQPPSSSATSVTLSNTSLSSPCPSAIITSAPSSSSLNINAEPFAFTRSNISKGKQAKKYVAEKSEVDFLKLQLNAAITRITQLDTEVNDYEKKVQILMTRLRSYEERDNKLAYEQNFSHNDFRAPSSTPASSPPPPPPCTCSSTPSQPSHSHKSQQQSCPCVPVPAACSPCCASSRPPPPPPNCWVSCHSAQVSCLPRNTPSSTENSCTNELSEVNITLRKLVDDMLKVKQSISNLESSSQRRCLPSQVSECSVTPLPSTATFEDPNYASKPPADTDESFVSIEEFIPDEELAGTSHHLNSNHPTTQHSMLKHPSPLLLSTQSPSTL
jgi:hypothetical protein